jgi:RNA polymerase-binding transcription factor DksA
MTPRNHTSVPGNRPKASTQQIIGSGTDLRIPQKWIQQFQQLVTLRDHLRQRKDGLTETAREEQPGYSLHMADAGTDQYDQDFALSMISSEQNAIYEVEQALNRIRNGTYGICELTGEVIEPERLEAIPWARFSLIAQKGLEERGEVGVTKFAQRVSLSEAEAEHDEDEDNE